MSEITTETRGQISIEIEGLEEAIKELEVISKDLPGVFGKVLHMAPDDVIKDTPDLALVPIANEFYLYKNRVIKVSEQLIQLRNRCEL